MDESIQKDSSVFANLDSFMPIPLATLEVDTVTGFDLYLRHEQQETVILYRGADLPFTKAHRNRLYSGQVSTLYILKTDHQEYLRYLGDRLSNIVADDSLPGDQRARIVYDATVSIARKVLRNPTIGENIKRAHSAAHATADLLFGDVRNILDLFKLMSYDYYTYTHSVNVCMIGTALGHKMGLSRDDLRELAAGLLLHDVGKSAIDERILRKRGPLTDEEMTIMKTHPAIGVNILRQTEIAGPESLAVVMQHHEKMNSAGYPRGSTGSDIHTYARIGALADVFDALTTRRSYRDAIPSFPALRVMQEEMAGSFDPGLFRLLVQLLREAPAAGDDPTADTRGHAA